MVKAVFIKMLMYREGGVTRGATAYYIYKHRESSHNRAVNIQSEARGVS